MPQVDLPPEESSVNLTQLVPELDLIGDKSKDKKDDSDEEVRLTNASETFLKAVVFNMTLTMCIFLGVV